MEVIVYDPISCRFVRLDEERLEEFKKKMYIENPDRPKFISMNDLYEAMGLSRLLNPIFNDPLWVWNPERQGYDFLGRG